MRHSQVGRFRKSAQNIVPGLGIVVAIGVMGGLGVAGWKNQNKAVENWAKTENVDVIEMDRTMIPRHLHMDPKGTQVFRGVVRRSDGAEQKVELHVRPQLSFGDRVVVDWEEVVALQPNKRQGPGR